MNKCAELMREASNYIRYTGPSQNYGREIWEKLDAAAEEMEGQESAPVAPAVPEVITPEMAPESVREYCEEAAEGYADGWNDCREAMLAASPAVDQDMVPREAINQAWYSLGIDRKGLWLGDFYAALDAAMDQDKRGEYPCPSPDIFSALDLSTTRLRAVLEEVPVIEYTCLADRKPRFFPKT